MRYFTIILSVLFTTRLIADTPLRLSSQQAGKLVEAAWQEPPRAIDITYCITVRDCRKTEEELRWVYEQAYRQIYGPEAQSSDHREEFIQKNLKRFLKEQREGGTKVKYRIRFDGNRLRVDKSYRGDAMATLRPTGDRESVSEEDPGVDLPFETSHIEVTDQNGVSERYVYSRAGRTATRQVMSHRAPFENSKIMQFALTPAAMPLRRRLGTRQGGSLLGPDDYYVAPEKLEELCTGTVDDMSVRIRPDSDGADPRDRIELSFHGDEQDLYAEIVMVCGRSDYSRVYHYDVRIPATDRLVWTRACNDFDAQGFPHDVVVTEYDGQGNVAYQETYDIQSVRINAPIPDAVFQFDPPKDYVVMDLRLTPAEQQAAEIVRLKEWLTHESWTDRVQALVALGKQLRDKPEELRAIATVMEDDEHPQVRAAAGMIRRRIDGDRQD